MSSTSKYREFSSYNGFDRTVMFAGVPLLWAIALLALSVLIMFVGFALFDIMGFLFAFLMLPVYLFLKTINQTDDKALDILMLEIKFRFKRTAYKTLGNTLTFVNDEFLRPKNTFIEQFTDIKDFVKERELG